MIVQGLDDDGLVFISYKICSINAECWAYL